MSLLVFHCDRHEPWLKYCECLVIKVLREIRSRVRYCTPNVFVFNLFFMFIFYIYKMCSR